MFVVNTSPNIAVNVQEGRLLSRRQRGWWTMWLYSIFLRSMRNFSAHSIRRSSDTSGHDTELKTWPPRARCSWHGDPPPDRGNQSRGKASKQQYDIDLSAEFYLTTADSDSTISTHPCRVPTRLPIV